MLLFVVLSDIFADQWLEDKLSNDLFIIIIIIIILSSSDSVLPKLLQFLKMECLTTKGICVSEDSNFSGVSGVAVNSAWLA